MTRSSIRRTCSSSAPASSACGHRGRCGRDYVRILCEPARWRRIRQRRTGHMTVLVVRVLGQIGSALLPRREPRHRSGLERRHRSRWTLTSAILFVGATRADRGGDGEVRLHTGGPGPSLRDTDTRRSTNHAEPVRNRRSALCSERRRMSSFALPPQAAAAVADFVHLAETQPVPLLVRASVSQHTVPLQVLLLSNRPPVAHFDRGAAQHCRSRALRWLSRCSPSSRRCARCVRRRGCALPRPSQPTPKCQGRSDPSRPRRSRRQRAPPPRAHLPPRSRASRASWPRRPCSASTKRGRTSRASRRRTRSCTRMRRRRRRVSAARRRW